MNESDISQSALNSANALIKLLRIEIESLNSRIRYMEKNETQRLEALTASEARNLKIIDKLLGD